jgi:hypothetical protein
VLHLLAAGLLVLAAQVAPIQLDSEMVPPDPLDGMIGTAREAAAQLVGVPAEQVTVASLEAVEWSDGSLGCPEAGMAYIQVIVPGYRLVLDAAGAVLEYHTDTRGSVTYCAVEPAGTESAPRG